MTLITMINENITAEDVHLRISMRDLPLRQLTVRVKHRTTVPYILHAWIVPAVNFIMTDSDSRPAHGLRMPAV